MPSSRLENLPWVIRWAYQLEPRSVLDIGCGTGLYGLALRSGPCGVYGPNSYRERGTFREPTVNAVEIWAPYLGEEVAGWHKSIYNNVWLGDICDMAKGLPHHDLVLAIDVLEHIEKKRALRMLRDLDFTWLIAVIPPNDLREDDYGGNRYESHVSTWSRADFVKPRVVKRSYEKLCVVWRKR